jgi:hypothetical protein
LWCILYGEIFVNIESYSQRTASIKSILLDTYKKLYTDVAIAKLATNKKNSAFENILYKILLKNVAPAQTGINTENLTILRTRFLLDFYYLKINEKYPWQMFAQQQFLLKQGLFDAYNQWLFGAVASPSMYQNWIQVHDQEAAAFKTFQQSRVFKVRNGEYYKIK